jgi:hypothetical protein
MDVVDRGVETQQSHFRAIPAESSRYRVLKERWIFWGSALQFSREC